MDGIRVFIQNSINESQLDPELRDLVYPAGLPQTGQSKLVFICKVVWSSCCPVPSQHHPFFGYYSQLIHPRLLQRQNWLSNLPWVPPLYHLSLSVASAVITNSCEPAGRVFLYFITLISAVLLFFIGNILLAHLLEVVFEACSIILFMGSILFIVILTTIIQIFFPFESLAFAIAGAFSAAVYATLVLFFSIGDELMNELFRKNDWISGSIYFFLFIF
ncbi:hypothetical protein O6P43_021656 [Quillaja saponaria]|uniref:Uncharacterized protein n=1 Tax=Quillaja saponaria TaxID=32244 RepID=A0AAD7PHE4_QUISA|nr:hypothetical protein O6P43_021656 [Quillaja saponaria]